MAEKKKDMEVTLVSQLDTKKPIYKITGKTQYIETEIDRLYKLVKERGSIKVSEAAKNIGVSEDTVRKWGEVLEEHKLIELHYPIAGKPSLGIRRPKLLKGKRVKEKKPRKPGIPRRKRFTKKVITIYIEIIVLGELLIYIFFVNRYLAMNFIPTVRFHFDGFITYIRNLITILFSGNFSALSSALLYQPMYLGFLIILIVIIILIIVLIIKSKKPKLYVSEKKPEKGEEKKEEKPKKEKPEKEKKKEKREEKKKERKDAVFADIIERYKERLKEMEK
jgi:hypothetical protein